MNKKIYEYPLSTDEIIAECSSCNEKFAPTSKHVSLVGDVDSGHTKYAACPKCGHTSEWFIKGAKWKKYSPEEIAKMKKIILGLAVFFIILFGYLCYALIDWSILKT